MSKKGAIGAARAKQIEAFCLLIFYQYLASSLSDNHFKLFLFLHSLLVLDEQDLRTTNESSDDISNNNSSQSYFKKFQLLSLALKENELQDLIGNLIDQEKRPEFVSLNSWQNLKEIESMDLNSFKNLTQSLLEDSPKWREYFWPHKTSNQDTMIKDVDLLNDSPLKSKLGIIEKMALWFCIRPDKVNQQNNLLISK